MLFIFILTIKLNISIVKNCYTLILFFELLQLQITIRLSGGQSSGGK